MKLYADASAIFKVLVAEDGSETAAALIEGATELVTASIGYVEARAALSRAAREGRLRRRALADARTNLELIWEESNVVALDTELVQHSGDVAEQAQLRAGDAIHLAAALTLDEPDLLFATWDRELQRAAREAGLAVAP